MPAMGRAVTPRRRSVLPDRTAVAVRLATEGGLLPVALVLDVVTPLGFRVICTADRWSLIAGVKHPAMTGRLGEVVSTLERPDEIRRSAKVPGVLLFHRRSGLRWVCAVARYNHVASVLITAYPADTIKRGDLVWTS